MTITQPFLVHAARRRSPWRVIAGGSHTSGSVMFGDAHMPPRTAGMPRHVHTHEDESIYVISGVLTVEVGEQRFEAGPGGFVWLPRQVPHTYANLSDETVWTVGVTSPAGLENLFAEQVEYFARLSGEPDPAVLRAMYEQYGIRPVDGTPLV